VRAAARFARALMAYHGRNFEGARKRLEPFFEKWKGLPMAPPARFVWANIHAGGEDAEKWKRAQQVYERLAEGPLGVRAQLAWGLAAANRGQTERAQEILAPAARRHERGGLFKMAAALRKALKEGPRSLGRHCRVVEAHQVFPGPKPVSFSPREGKRDQLIRYELKASVRADCKQMGGYWFQVSALEPRVPAAEKELSFYRLPVLYR
jgi:hypothetical protein